MSATRVVQGAGQGLKVATRTGLLLPSTRAAQADGQGWKITTCAAPSKIQGAGTGRFALENVSKDACLVVKPYVTMSQIETLSKVPADHTITYSNVDDLEKYISLCEMEGGHSRERILQELSNFVWSYDGKRACLNQSSWLANHAGNASQGLNLEFVDRRLDDGRLATVGVAVEDIHKEDELYNDYRKFVMPEFYLAFCEDNNIKDVRTLVMEAIGE